MYKEYVSSGSTPVNKAEEMRERFLNLVETDRQSTVSALARLQRFKENIATPQPDENATRNIGPALSQNE